MQITPFFYRNHFNLILVEVKVVFIYKYCLFIICKFTKYNTFVCITTSYYFTRLLLNSETLNVRCKYRRCRQKVQQITYIDVGNSENSLILDVPWYNTSLIQDVCKQNNAGAVIQERLSMMHIWGEVYLLQVIRPSLRRSITKT